MIQCGPYFSDQLLHSAYVCSDLTFNLEKSTVRSPTQSCFFSFFFFFLSFFLLNPQDSEFFKNDLFCYCIMFTSCFLLFLRLKIRVHAYVVAGSRLLQNTVCICNTRTALNTEKTNVMSLV